MSKNHNIEKFHRPEIFLSELVKRSAQGQLFDNEENVPFVYRALVLAVDVDGGMLENHEGSGGVSHVFGSKKSFFPARIGPSNPRNSIKARIISEGRDQFISDDEAPVFWPFFPEHISVPIKPGEHTYVMFEDRNFMHGLWISKVSGHENLNFFSGKDSFAASENRLSQAFGDSSRSQDQKQDELASQRTATDGRLSRLF